MHLFLLFSNVPLNSQTILRWLHFSAPHYDFSLTFHDKMQSFMHNFTHFSREKELNLKCFHSFREMKSEFSFPFTLFENEKWNDNALRSRSRMKSEMKMPRDRDREVKFQKKSREFSRNDTLAGYWITALHSMISISIWGASTNRRCLMCLLVQSDN